MSKVESRRVEALAATNSEVEALVSAMDALKTQAALKEGKLSSLQVSSLSFCSPIIIYLNFIRRIGKRYTGGMYISESRAARYGSSSSQRENKIYG